MSRSPQEILSRGLSLLPTPCRNPVSQNVVEVKEAEGDPSWVTSTFRKIGFGQCGLVFTVPDRPGMVVKIARPHFGESLFADFLAHRVVEGVFDDEKKKESGGGVFDGVQLPRVFGFMSSPLTGSKAFHGGGVLLGGGKDGEDIPSPEEWWDSHVELFPPLTSTSTSTGARETAGASQYSKFSIPSEALFTEHIPPLSATIRNALIELYCFPESKRVSVRADPANQDCLLRVYLGRRRPQDEETGLPRYVANFALRNYNLHLDQMLELGLDVQRFAAMMGVALAVVHWGAGVDAFDVEFVLGGRRRRRRKGHSETGMGDDERVADLWLLDFNLCSRFEVDQLVSGGDDDDAAKLHGLVEHLVYAFFANDPYYPRPRTREDWQEEGKNKGWEEGDILLWDTFAKEYMDQADEVLRSRNREIYERLRELPRRFIQACVDKQRTLPPGVDKIGVD